MFAPLVALVFAASPKLAVLPMVAGEGVTDKTAGALTEALAAEVRKRAGAEVITQREINTVISLERQKAMMGCASDACMAELGGALGVDRLVNGDIARVGESLLVHVRLVDVAKVRVLAQADRRLRNGTLDDLLDALPAMVSELFDGAGVDRPAAGAKARPPAAEPETGAVAGPKASARPVPSPWVDEPEKVAPEKLEKLALWEDGGGRYLATDPASLDAGLYAGSARKLYRVRVGSGGLDGTTGKGDRSFWEPRLPNRGQFGYEPGAARLSCGSEVPLKPVPAAEAKRLLARAEFFAPPFRRVPHLLARDDQGVYFLVDGARQPGGEPADPPDFRLYVGKKGSMARVDLEDAVVDDGGYVFVTAGGRLVARRQGRKFAVEWATGTTRLALTWLDAADHTPLIYRELGPYAGKDLGTPCDGRF